MNKTLLVIIVSLIGFSDSLQAQQTAAGNQTLNTRQQKIVAIAALTAKGDLDKLKPVLHAALDSGLTVNEIKEVIVHLSAYCGFPRSLNGINTFLAVSNERKAKGITDPVGAEPFPISRAGNKYEVGKKNLEKLTGRPESGPKTGYAAFVPVIDTLLKEHLFADIFNRGVLTWQDRELTTVSALVNLGGVEAQLQGHLSISLNVGITEQQLGQLITIVENHIGKSEAEAGKAVLNRVLDARRRPN
jgi:alkylhydroperoxidase/carboxymuconolactone decarboxylase family protein YurZ